MSDEAIIALSVSIGPVLVACITLWQVRHVKKDVKEIHLSINSRMDALLLLTAELNIKKGREQVMAGQLSEEAKSALAKIAPEKSSE